MPAPTHADPSPRSTYRHGDLRRALLDAGIEMARQGGPEAVVLREATRRAGVVPNAAYRHFANRDALLQAVRAAALGAVAAAMEEELARLSPELPAADFARASVRAVGTGYLRFARNETGLFRTAFATPVDMAGVAAEDRAGPGGLDPFQLLGAALDRLVSAGAMPPQERPGAEMLAWSAVHGMALLAIEGPLRARPVAELEAMGQRLLDMVERGLGAGSARWPTTNAAPKKVEL